MSDQGQAQSKPQGGGLQAQLDALLAQTDTPEPTDAASEASELPEEAATAAMDDIADDTAAPSPADVNGPLDRVVDRTIEAGLEYDEGHDTEAPAADQAGVGEALATQIQSLLDDASDEHNEQADATEMQAQAQLTTEFEGSFESPQSMDIQIEPDTLEPPTQTSASAAPHTDAQPQHMPGDAEADTTTIEQIDQMLADDADDALAGEFATVDDILNADVNSDAAPVQAAAADDVDHQTPDTPEVPAEVAATFDDISEAQPAQDVDASAAQYVDPAALELEFEQQFTYESPADEDAADGASADDVGAELDDQPEHHVLAKDADEAAAQSLAQQQAAEPATRVKQTVVIAEKSLRRFCALVNQPLQDRSAEVRQTVGWVGVVSLFNGICLLIYSILH